MPALCSPERLPILRYPIKFHTDSPIRPRSECQVHRYLDTVFIDAGMIQIGKPPDIIDTETFKNIFDADGKFHIRRLAHPIDRVLAGECKKSGIA